MMADDLPYGLVDTGAALDRSAVARYLQLADYFRQRIARGDWPVGGRLPTVEQLAAECGVASMTLRRALDILAAEGLITRHRARGTFVAARPPRDLWCEVQTDWRGLLIARYTSRIEILLDRPAAPPAFLDPGTWPGRPAPRYRRMRRRYWREGVAFMVADLYIDADACALIPPDALTSCTAMQLVSDLPGRPIAQAHQELSVIGADLLTSEQLSVPLGAPMARVIRLAVDAQGVQVLAVDGTYRGDLTRVRIKLQ